jgi:hypothetical protein
MQTLLRSGPQPCREIYGCTLGVLYKALSDLNKIGFTCFPELIDATLLSELRSEALRCKHDAKRASSTSGHGYRAQLSGLGEAGRAFLTGSTMAGLIGAMFHIPLEPDKIASCYTYYQPGDFLGAHVDHPEQCSVTAILYLDVVRSDRDSDRTGLELHILSASPSDDGSQPRAIMTSEPGSLIVGLGSLHWHERPMLQDGEYLTAMTACYSVPGPD